MIGRRPMPRPVMRRLGSALLLCLVLAACGAPGYDPKPTDALAPLHGDVGGGGGGGGM